MEDIENSFIPTTSYFNILYTDASIKSPATQEAEIYRSFKRQLT